MRLFKYVFSILLCACLLLAAVPAASAAEYTVVGTTAVGIPVPGYEPGSVSTNCWTFAQAIYEIVWGQRFTGDRGDADDMLRSVPLGSARAITLENTKRFISAARPGAVIRISQNVYGGDDVGGFKHSQILVSHDENGFTVYEGSINGKVRLKYFTWEDYAYGYFGQHYGYFKYIKWPGAAAFRSDADYGSLRVTAQYNGKTLTDLTGYATFDVLIDGALKANDVSAYSDVLPEGSAYEIRDVRPGKCLSYSFTRSEALSGKLTGKNATVTLYLTDAHEWTGARSLGAETHMLICGANSSHTMTEPHSWDGGMLTATPGERAEAVLICTCTVCGEQKTTPVPDASAILRVSGGKALPGDTVTLTVSAASADALNALTPVFDTDAFTLTETLRAPAASGSGFTAVFKLKVNEKTADGDYTVTVSGAKTAVLGGRLTVLDPDALPAYLPGDVDGDGRVSASDARLALRATVGLESFEPRSAAFLACDTDGDEMLTANDARSILRAVVGLEEIGSPISA